MALLTIGVALWAIVHLMPALAPGLKSAAVVKMGEKAYRGLFALLIFLSIALMVMGWRSIEQPVYLYVLPPWTRQIGILIVVFGFLFMGAAKYRSRIRQYVRHPQLTGFALWALAHVGMNGDSRSLVLFGGLGLWAILEIFLLNRRDSTWAKPDPVSWGGEIVGLLVSLGVVALFVFIHPWIAGVALS